MWSNIFLASCLIFLSSISHLDITGDNSPLKSSVPNSLQLLKQEFVPHLEANYARSDGFYLRWLKAHNFNFVKTREGLSQFAFFRRSHNISNRGKGDKWANENVPVETLQDKDGEPVLYYAMAKYNLSKFSEENKLKEFPIALMRGVDRACEIIYDRQQAGQNVSHLSVFVDWTGFSAKDQLCPQCIPTYVDIVRTYEANYPLTFKNIVHIRTPKQFRPVMAMMKAVMSKELANAYHVFAAGQDDSAKVFLDSWLGKSNNVIMGL